MRLPKQCDPCGTGNLFNMRARRSISLLLLCVLLSVSTSANAILFIFLASRAIGAASDRVTGAEGDICVGEAVKVGDQIDIAGKGLGTVKSLSGTSRKCRMAEAPIRALMEFPEPLAAGAESTECVGHGAKVGDRITVPGQGRAVIKSLRLGGGCIDQAAPVEANVIGLVPAGK